MIRMPGEKYTGPLPPLTDAQLLLREELKSDINKLASQIGERNILNFAKLDEAADFIDSSLAQAGYKVHRQSYQVQDETCYNIEAEVRGAILPEEIVIVGGHYDSFYGSPGANDNASGVAATLALARQLAGRKTARTLRFVFFANEEPPFYRTEQMGSRVYAKSCSVKGEAIIAMLCLETIGYYLDEPDSQKYPFPLSLVYPSTGDFIAFVSNFSSRHLLHKVIASFRKGSKFPSEGGAIPEAIAGISWSDHWSFGQEGYPAIMITDTAVYRYPYYHMPEDTADKIDYDRLARVVSALEAVVMDVVGGSAE
ncbi:MAG: M28 family peptidase [Planctomycetota bacterium]|jgi:Zn-dependent M28 family amino/carboxypeptidase